jgi:hypothetical protein
METRNEVMQFRESEVEDLFFGIDEISEICK